MMTANAEDKPNEQVTELRDRVRYLELLSQDYCQRIEKFRVADQVTEDKILESQAYKQL